MYKISQLQSAREDMRHFFPGIRFEKLLEDPACKILTACTGYIYADCIAFSRWLVEQGMPDNESMNEFILRSYGRPALDAAHRLFGIEE